MARKSPKDPATLAWQEGLQQTLGHPLFQPFNDYVRIYRNPAGLCPQQVCAAVTSRGEIHCHPTRRLSAAQWCWVLGHCLIHLGLEHHREHAHCEYWNLACDEAVARLLTALKWGTPPEEYPQVLPQAAGNEEARYAELLRSGQEAHPPRDLVFAGRPHDSISWSGLLAHGIRQAVHQAMARAGGVESPSGSARLTPIQQARDWFMASYPLLGSLATAFEIVEDARICRAQGVDVAAIDEYASKIYLNSAVHLEAAEIRFIMAHEFLHAGLCHSDRARGRDPYLWNVACDFVINDWLIEMGVGQPPRLGLLYDPELKGQSAENIYERIVCDARTWRKRGTFRGIGLGDMLGPPPGASDWTGLEDFYRRCLARGFALHQSSGRGFLPGGLVEAIQALDQPPIPWDVELARWFDRFFPPLERVRTYARPSRRQQSCPDIPRPSRNTPGDRLDARTFGVVLDTSGSMERKTLGKALGAIAAYALSRDVPAVRLVCCDAQAYDEGYLPAEAIAGRVRLKGRGGTVLQPALDLLERSEDFPPQGPILIITDGACDSLNVPGARKHAFLLPCGRALPFSPRGPVFRIQD